MKKLFAIAVAVVMAVALCVTAAAIHNPDDTTKVWFDRENLNISWDTVYIDGQSQMDLGWGGDGSAQDKVEANPITVGSAETITIRGWAGIKEGKAVEFGYRLNEGEPVFSADFAKTTEDAVINAGGDSRFEIVVPVKGLTAPTLITAVAKGEDGAVCDFIEFSVNGQYTGGSSDPQPVEAGEDQWLCGADPGSAVTTGWWFNPVGEHDDRFVLVSFKANSSFRGVHGFYFCSNPVDYPDLGLEYAKMKVEIINKEGAAVAEAELGGIGDNWVDIDFGQVFGPGEYQLRYTCKSGSGIENNCWCVIGACEGSGDTHVDANVNGPAAGYPALMLIGASSGSNPGTADASVIAIAAVACVALAGVVVAKKVR